LSGVLGVLNSELLICSQKNNGLLEADSPEVILDTLSWHRYHLEVIAMRIELSVEWNNVTKIIRSYFDLSLAGFDVSLSLVSSKFSHISQARRVVLNVLKMYFE
jgi:hypothetical protein